MRRLTATTRSPLRRLALACALASGGLLALAPSAFASLIAPETGASPNASKISDLYVVTLVIAAIIFVIVEGALLYSLIRFRRRKGRVAAQIHGNTRLEVGWTVGAAVILIALAVVTFAELDSIRNPPPSSPDGLTAAEIPTTVYADGIKPPKGPYLTVQVNGQQYVWRYTYLNYGTQADQLDDPYTAYQMVVPTDTTVILKIVSQDVVHSWWIPQLGGKFQAVPGYTNWTWFKISKPGNYFGQCAFICGIGHARMKAEVTALPRAQFLHWIHHHEANIKQANATQSKARSAQQNKTGAGAVEVP